MALLCLAHQTVSNEAELSRLTSIGPDVCRGLLVDVVTAGFARVRATERGLAYELATNLPLPSMDELLALHR